MRGFPLLQVVMVAVLFALAGVPVWRLTHPRPIATAAKEPAVAANPSASQSLTVSLHFDPAPAEFQLMSLGQPVLTGRGPAVDFSGPWDAPLTESGADIALQARWTNAPEDNHPAPAATAANQVRVTVRFPDGRQTESTYTAPVVAASLVEIITVKP